jgi:hypothetical protein
MWGGAITRLQLRQTISRLRKLDELPGVPSENLAVPEVEERVLREGGLNVEQLENEKFIREMNEKELQTFKEYQKI